MEIRQTKTRNYLSVLRHTPRYRLTFCTKKNSGLPFTPISTDVLRNTQNYLFAHMQNRSPIQSEHWRAAAIPHSPQLSCWRICQISARELTSWRLQRLDGGASTPRAGAATLAASAPPRPGDPTLDICAPPQAGDPTYFLCAPPQAGDAIPDLCAPPQAGAEQWALRVRFNLRC